MQGRPWWMIFLALYLLLSALLVLTNITFAAAPIVLAILAILAAIALFAGK